MFPFTRLRRLRRHPQLRELIRETTLSPKDLILPLFVRHGKDQKIPIGSMPGHYQLSVNRLAEEIREVRNCGIPGVILFGIPEHKDADGSDARSDSGIVQQAIHEIKSIDDSLLVITDVCYCEFTDHGHCGILVEDHGHVDVDNDATLAILQEQAVSHARAGADMVAPSGMMDGVIEAMRTALDDSGFTQIPIMSYAAKYCSGFYGPFREA
ncbi:MAG TPA: porphobilinogen synthase, partial [Planctomicrobium sp.]|nr:porphobilinogen synthase [Planctomicrobium sp.]